MKQMPLIPLALTLCTLATAEPPNIVLIYGDDVGYGDVGAYGSVLIPTPNIDRLAADGLRFTDGHCSAATCTPSRFSLLTGVHGFRHGVRVLAPNAPLTIPTDWLTLPKILKRGGYDTAIVGKWHLGLGAKGTPTNWNGDVKPGPLEVGFDDSFLLPSTNDRVPCVYLDGHRVVGLDPSDPLYVGKKPEGVKCTAYPNGKTNPEAMTYYGSTHGHNNSVINGIGRIGTMYGGSHALWDDETMADVFVKESIEWLIQRDKEKPFFLFFSSQDIHVPRAPHPRFQGKTTLGHRGDAMVALDWVVGRILDELDAQGIAENTLVIFTSDNGPVYDDGYEDGTTVRTSTKEVDQGHDGSGIFRGGKYQIYEGGTRVPFIVRWPGHIKPGTSDATVSQIDFAASFAELVGVELKEHEVIDSRNMLSAFLGTSKVGVPFLIEEAGPVALREGPWKYISPRGKGKAQLYNLDSDIGEQENVISQFPDVAERLGAMLEVLKKAKNQKGVRAYSAESAS